MIAIIALNHSGNEKSPAINEKKKVTIRAAVHRVHKPNVTDLYRPMKTSATRPKEVYRYGKLMLVVQCLISSVLVHERVWSIMEVNITTPYHTMMVTASLLFSNWYPPDITNRPLAPGNSETTFQFLKIHRVFVGGPFGLNRSLSTAGQSAGDRSHTSIPTFRAEAGTLVGGDCGHYRS